MKREGFSVCIANDGQEASTRCAARRPIWCCST
jgi:hypothetical protein